MMLNNKVSILKRTASLISLLLAVIILCIGCTNTNTSSKEEELEETEKEYIPVKGFDELIENCKKAVQTKDSSLVPEELRYIFISSEVSPAYYGYAKIDFGAEQMLAIYSSSSIQEFDITKATLCRLYKLDEEGYAEAVVLETAGDEDESSYSYDFVYTDSYPDTLLFMCGCFSYNDESEDRIELYATLDDYNDSLPTATYDDWNISLYSGEATIETDDGEVVLRIADFEIERFVTPDEKSITPSLYFGDKFDVTGYWQAKGEEDTWYHFIDDHYYEIIYKMDENEVYITDRLSYEFFDGIFYIDGNGFEVTEEGYLFEYLYFDPITYIPVAEPVFDVELKPYSDYIKAFEDWLNS